MPNEVTSVETKDVATEAPGQADSAARAGSAPDMAVALRNAFRLGYGLVELRSRIEIALFEAEESLGSAVRLASMWRASFGRLAALQATAFPDATTATGAFDPPAKEALPYLYSSDENKPDYANVGISGLDPRGTQILPNFRLCDVTRRAINCLTMMYLKKEDSLVPDVLTTNQAELLARLDEATKTTGDSSAGQTAAGAHGQGPIDVNAARTFLTARITSFLDAWDGYVREHYYTTGLVPNDELELIAYEAGRSIASISWTISAKSAQARATARTHSPEEQQSEDVRKRVVDGFTGLWTKVFADTEIIRLQRQIGALSCALDDAYYARPEHKGELRGAGDRVLTSLSPDVPSECIAAVKHSLDYWQRAVPLICKSGAAWMPDTVDGIVEQYERLRITLTEQSNIWQSLITGQQSLRSFTLETVTQQIIHDVIAEFEKQAQKDLRRTVAQTREQLKAMGKQAIEAVAEAKQSALDGLETVFAGFKGGMLYAAAGVVLVTIVLVAIGLYGYLHPQAASGASSAAAGGGVSTLFSLVLGYLGFTKSKQEKDSQKQTIERKQTAASQAVESHAAESTSLADAVAGAGQNLLTRAQHEAQSAAAEVLKAFERGYEQIRVELQGLSRSIAVTYPLLELFGSQLQGDLKGDLGFLNEVLWTGKEREAELKRIATAAFGPVAAFVGLTPESE